MKFSQNGLWCAAILLSLVSLSAQAATDSEIDRLLKKLPPPEKLVQRNEHVVRVADPALNDPLVKQIDAATNAKQWKRAFELSRQLAARHPSSAAANYYAGYCAAEAKLYPEATASYRRAIAIQPQLVLGHFSLALIEWKQGHRGEALQHLRQVTKLEPKAAAGWAILSMAADIVGNRQESVTAARRLVVVAPREPAAWVRLSVAERNIGNGKAATEALNRAVQVAGGAKASAPKKSTTSKKAASKKKG